MIRPDLWELNELNFARFDSKLEQRLGQLRAELRQEISGLRLEFRRELQSLRTELLGWMFGFLVITLVAIAEMLVALR